MKHFTPSSDFRIKTEWLDTSLESESEQDKAKSKKKKTDETVDNFAGETGWTFCIP